MTVREARSSQAAVLVTAEVGDWRVCQLPDGEDYDSLEVERSEVPSWPRCSFPVHLRRSGSPARGAPEVHVVAGACPMADPWPALAIRWPADEVTLVGVYVEGAAGS